MQIRKYIFIHSYIQLTMFAYQSVFNAQEPSSYKLLLSFFYIKQEAKTNIGILIQPVLRMIYLHVITLVVCNLTSTFIIKGSLVICALCYPSGGLMDCTKYTKHTYLSQIIQKQSKLCCVLGRSRTAAWLLFIHPDILKVGFYNPTSKCLNI